MDALVIGIEPVALARVQQRWLDEPEVDRRKRQRLEAEHRPLAALDRRRS